MRNKRIFKPVPLPMDENGFIDFSKANLPTIPKGTIEEEIKPSEEDRNRLKVINNSLKNQSR